MGKHEIATKKGFFGSLANIVTGGSEDKEVYKHSGTLSDAKEAAQDLANRTGETVELRCEGDEPGISPYEDGIEWFSPKRDDCQPDYEDEESW